jgi:hypothetical protein
MIVAEYLSTQDWQGQIAAFRDSTASGATRCSTRSPS